MKKAFITLIICLSMVFTTGCTKINENKIDNSITNTNDNTAVIDTATNNVAEKKFPYTDENEKIRYKLMINNIEVKTENYPFAVSKDDKSAFLPIKDILSYLNVESLSSDDGAILTTKLNGDVIKLEANEPKMIIGKRTLQVIDENTKPTLVNNVLYVPDFFFMRMSDNNVIDFNSNEEYVKLSTDLIVDPNSSGTAGLKINTTSSSTSGSSSNESHVCSRCHGAGGYNEEYFEQYLVNGRWQQTKKYRWRTCPVCGGSGYIK